MGKKIPPSPSHVHGRPELVQQGQQQQKSQKKRGGIYFWPQQRFSHTMAIRPARPASTTAAATTATAAGTTTSTRRGWSDYVMPPVTNTTGICIESNTMCYYMQGELYETFFTRPSTMCHLPNMITLNCWLPKEAVLSRSSSR